MILSNTTYNVSRLAEQDWLQWMQKVHIPNMLATGLPVDSKMLRLLTEIDNEGVTYSIQFTFPSMEEYLAYQNDHQEAFYQKHHDRYKERYHSFSSLLEEVG